jgi:hypothetical protein
MNRRITLRPIEIIASAISNVGAVLGQSRPVQIRKAVCMEQPP